MLVYYSAKVFYSNTALLKKSTIIIYTLHKGVYGSPPLGVLVIYTIKDRYHYFGFEMVIALQCLLLTCN